MLEHFAAGELALGHAGTGEDAGALNIRRGGDYHDGVDQGFAARLEQQRNIEDGDRRARLERLIEEFAPDLRHQRVDDGFEPGQGFRPAGDEGAEAVPLHGPSLDDAGDGGPDRLHRCAARRIDPVHGRVGVVDGNPLVGE